MSREHRVSAGVPHRRSSREGWARRAHFLQTSGLRTLLWRLGRKLYSVARLEGQNDPACNGEYWLLNQVVAGSAMDRVFVDIGANRGDWTAQALACLQHAGGWGRIHAFEPTSTTYAHLTARFAGHDQVLLSPLALSDAVGARAFYVLAALSGRNSLHHAPDATPETVRTQTLDDYLAAAQLPRVTLVKSDTEGHDLSVLRGAALALRAGRIDVWQFEYNHRWLDERAALRDVFTLIQGTPYRFGKLFQGGIETYDTWHPELERYFETNCVLLRRGCSVEAYARAMRFDARNTPVPA